LKIVGLLLAAGSATRFGSDKLRHALPHGVPIAIQSARNLRAELAEVFVAVRDSAAAGAFEEERCTVAVCENANEGMGASLACAARAAGPRDGYIVALADMPFVRRTSIAAVRDAIERGAAIAAPYFRARRGHPVGIAGRFYQQLMELKGDEGARRIVTENAAALVKIPVGDPGVVRDIDRPEDLAPPVRV
jgi:molybdenum cofactor cytidylyltransferase